MLVFGLEVEVGVAPPSWATTDLVDPGTRGVVEDGMRIGYDPERISGRLADSCRP